MSISFRPGRPTKDAVFDLFLRIEKKVDMGKAFDSVNLNKLISILYSISFNDLIKSFTYDRFFRVKYNNVYTM